jgi:hypothetical protein
MSITLGNIKFMGAFTFGTGKTWTEVGTVSTSAQTVTVPGLETMDRVLVIKPTEQTGVEVVKARVSAANTLTVVFMNPTAGGLTPTAEEAYLAMVWRPEVPTPTNAVG